MKTTIINKILLVLMLITAQQVSALEFQVDGIYYRTSIFTKNSAYVTHSGTSYTESVEYQGEVVIPESVTYNGKTYTIASIGGYAFAGCPGLTSVTIPNTVTTINQNAFNGCTGLKTIECKATTPPALGDNAFTSYDATLVVPSSSESVYKSAAGWSNFKFKEESSETPGSGNTGGGSGNDNGDDTGGSAVPEVCYLVGNYNGWSVPNIENVDDLYTLTDPDKDGVYYGKFYFNKDEFEFKIFLGIGDWSNGDLILGIEDNTSISMNNISETFTLHDSNSSNIACLGWIGGYVEIFFDFNNKTLRFTIPNENNTLVYKITSSTDVEVIAGAGKYKGDIVIPSQVTISGKTYTVTSIANDAFKGCTGLTSITIPSSITSIGSSSFDSCTNLNKVSISDMLSWCKITFANSLANPLYYAKNLYLNGSLVSKLEIPSAITEIKNYTFYNCTSISTIVFPSGILKIGNSAFVNCSNLTSVTIPNSVTTIDENAFNGCTGLASLTIGSSVGSIGNYAFGNCTGLKSVTSLNSTPPTCGTGVFQGVTISSIPLTVPAGSESLYKATYTWQDFKYKEESENPGDDPAVDTSGLKYNIISSTDVEVIGGTEKYTGDIVIPSQTTIDGKTYNVTKISDYAFHQCSSLTRVSIPNSVTVIGNFAFYGCTSLTNVSIPNSVTNIGEYAFRDCIGLTSIEIPNSVTSIADETFCNCKSLTSIEIPNSVTSIGNNAFLWCSSLTSISIPYSVTSIGSHALGGCSSLVSIVVESGNNKYDSRNNCNAIIETASNTLIAGCMNSIIPNSVTVIGDGAFGYCSYLTSIEIPNSVISIDNNAFYRCSGLTSVTIGSSVTSIGVGAFYDCSGLTRVTSLRTTPPTCGTDVFYNVSVGNITLEVPAGSVSLYQSADTWKDFGTIETYISYPVGLSKMWAIPADVATSFCSVRTGNGFGDTFFGSNYQAGVIEEWKDGVLVTSYDVNKFCADNNLGETVKVIDSETGTETEKFQSYLLWTAVMVDDAGNVLANVGLGAGSATTCQNWVLLPASDRNAMQLLHIDEFPSIDVVKGRVDVPSRIVGNITDGGAYLYIPATGSALLPVMYIGLDDDGKIYYDAENSWILMSSLTFDASTNVATFQTADEILNAADEAAVAAKTYVRWRVQDAPFTWNAETSQFEKNESFVPGVVGTPGMDVFKIGEIEYIVLPVKSATTGSRGSSVAVYSLADGTEVASWDATSAVDYYVGSVQARVNPDGKTANIYVCGHKDCFGILKFYPGSSVKSIANEGLSYGKGSSALDEIVTEENAAVEYYNLQGVRVMNPEKGIYIKRQGGKTSKVVL